MFRTSRRAGPLSVRRANMAVMSQEQAGEEVVDRFQLVSTTLEQKFKVESIVAEGGFGVVYKGVHLTLDKAIAVKVLKTPDDFNEAARAAFIQKFALEAKTIARISHPNIVQALDFGVSKMPSGEIAPWMVLEWITGQSLDHALEARRGQGGRPAAEMFAMFRPAIEALAYAHDEGIAHRDIKPANIMAVSAKRGSTLKLMDFGIAKVMETNESAGSGATRTRNTLSAFSPQYAAPEQFSSTRTGPWTDVHALALIATEILTDMPPYDGEDLMALMVDAMSPKRPTPGKRGIDAGPLEPVLAKALALKPEARYQNAGEFLAALEEAVSQCAPLASQTARFAAVAATPNAKPEEIAPTRQTGIANGPTTLRSSVVTQDVEALITTPNRSRTPLIAGVVAAVVLGGVGTAGYVMRRGAQTPQASIASMQAHATTTPAVQPQPQEQAPVHAEPPIAPAPSPTPSPPTLVALQEATASAGGPPGATDAGVQTTGAHAVRIGSNPTRAHRHSTRPNENGVAFGIE